METRFRLKTAFFSTSPRPCFTASLPKNLLALHGSAVVTVGKCLYNCTRHVAFLLTSTFVTLLS
ncbi:MAG: hypothetical protein KME64_14305 [Scytonematopsis contorta HA4267-MV1]|nr:hypothetical protein [Scytonematopsis contorta HA4267-MV1]